MDGRCSVLGSTEPKESPLEGQPGPDANSVCQRRGILWKTTREEVQRSCWRARLTERLDTHPTELKNRTNRIASLKTK